MIEENIQSELINIVCNQFYPLLFATVSGAHLYGFPSHNSDYDLRGVHVLPVNEIIGLLPLKETIETAELKKGLDLDLVTHDLKKFINLMQKNNGYVLEQLYSPIVIHSTEEHLELKTLGERCVTKYHAHHYLGFAESQWKLYNKDEDKRIKPLLYVFRVLLTGIYLMKTGLIEANLTALNEEFKLPYITDLIQKKASFGEKAVMNDKDFSFYESEYERLISLLEEAFKKTKLRETCECKEDLSDFLVRTRLKYSRCIS